MTTRVIIRESQEIAVCDYGDDADVIFERYKDENEYCVKTVFDGVFWSDTVKEHHAPGCKCEKKPTDGGVGK